MDIAGASQDPADRFIGGKAPENSVERHRSAPIVSADEIPVDDPRQQTRLPFGRAGDAGSAKQIAIEASAADRRHGFVPDLAEVKGIALDVPLDRHRPVPGRGIRPDPEGDVFRQWIQTDLPVRVTEVRVHPAGPQSGLGKGDHPEVNLGQRREVGILPPLSRRDFGDEPGEVRAIGREEVTLV